ncbi:flagellar basal body-associated FliL family protein [Desulfovibrio cuneatus]|uniref:flagellar basal body-associated FliL family protein n=1 Tax=Desulfovibrio cuneatus TaxID=159728 RepID=UPI0003F89AC6|nr:flagellar basal body-associated FliL family protein [Desulfovibrio cuneatus]
MLFLVPDPDDTPNAAAQPQAAPTNVELDLDDAPFLSAPEPEPTEPPPPLDFPEKVALPEPDTKAKGKGGLAGLLANKKRLILIGASLVLLVIGAVVVNIFLFSAPDKPKEAPAPKPEARKVVVPSAPGLAPAPPIAKFMVTWPAFNVPLKGAEGEVAIFTITLTIPIDEPLLKSELEARNTVLRDAVYYYLSRKTLESLMDSSRAEELREQLVQVINEHMTSGKIQKVFIEDFYSGGM